MVITRTPLRMSFVGGGSDLKAYYGHGYGAVVSAAINKYIYVAVTEKYDECVYLSYSKVEVVRRADELEHHIVRSALQLAGLDTGIAISYMSDLPLRDVATGLAASSSLAVGMMHALRVYKGEPAHAEQLARDACTIEIEMLGHPVGKQDQYAAAYGGMNYLGFHSDERVEVRPLRLDPLVERRLEERLLLFYTGMTMTSGEVLKEQQENTPLRRGALGAMVSLAEQLPGVLHTASFAEFSAMLHQNWELKRTLASNISNPVIDGYYARARAAGSGGGKILGSGGGGFLLLFCEPERQQNVREALKDLREMPFRFESEGSRVIYKG